MSSNENLSTNQRQTFAEFKERAEEVQGPYIHALIFIFHPEASNAEYQQAVKMVTDLGKLPGIMAWTVRESLDQRKGRTVLELGVFENGQAFLDFREHPKHTEFSSYVREIADWQIVDFPAAPVVQHLGTLGILGAGQPES